MIKIWKLRQVTTCLCHISQMGGCSNHSFWGTNNYVVGGSFSMHLNFHPTVILSSTAQLSSLAATVAYEHFSGRAWFERATYIENEQYESLICFTSICYCEPSRVIELEWLCAYLHSCYELVFSAHIFMIPMVIWFSYTGTSSQW
jgi:hypothetical protein